MKSIGWLPRRNSNRRFSHGLVVSLKYCQKSLRRISSNQSSRKAFFIVATSNLQRQVSNRLSIHFGGYTIRENSRPDWLMSVDGERLELDFVIEELKCAIEVQGQQHYKYIPHMHGDYNGFLKRVRNDNRKKELCSRFGLRLYEISSESDIQGVVESISSTIRPVEFIPSKRLVGKSLGRPSDKEIGNKVAKRNILEKLKSIDTEMKSEYPDRNRIVKLGIQILRSLHRNAIDPKTL